ncbi:hypothetical protein HMPREF9585_00659 [Cutibacterium acnes HL083PA1]|uniref:hypothetical protein n=1 Tax=Cutibacterium acnes TaxID=1747 RepID=UPI0001EF42FD|nr:hypothetical protein [Cutibacterium acnes]EFS49358.1 hypothetical protein HMPREF9585_00659 [Cutibacterium acnes HL083PA1]
MVVFIIAMVLILAVALGVCAVVMLGLRHPGADPDASFGVTPPPVWVKISAVFDIAEAVCPRGFVN